MIQILSTTRHLAHKKSHPWQWVDDSDPFYNQALST